MIYDGFEVKKVKIISDMYMTIDGEYISARDKTRDAIFSGKQIPFLYDDGGCMWSLSISDYKIIEVNVEQNNGSYSLKEPSDIKQILGDCKEVNIKY